MPKSRRYDQIVFEEPLIDISMQPTEEVDPLFIDPTDESINNEIEDESPLNGFCIFSPKTGANKQKEKKSISSEKEAVNVKKEKQDEVVKVKDEPKDYDDDFDDEPPEEEEEDPVDALARALNQVEYLCPKCTFRSTIKEEVSQHFVSSHRVFQIGIPRPCDKCDFIAKTVRELAAHKKQSHPRTTNVDNLPTLPTGEYKCPHCDFTSFHRNNVRSHTRVHTKDIVYTCDKCPYTAISRINIENHAARHLIKSRKKWKFKCKHCGLLERTEKLLQMHLILHGEGEMLKCQLCSYKSPYNHIISMHTRICHGILGKRSWDKEEKWKRRVRQSTRSCVRGKKSYKDDNNDDIEADNFPEEFLELPIKKSNRGRKKKNYNKENTTVVAEGGDKSKTAEPEDKEKSKENTTDPTQNEITEKRTDVSTTEPKEEPKRPTLEERIGRARDLIINKFSLKKKKIEVDINKDEKVPRKVRSKSTDSVEPSGNEENHSDSDENASDEESENQSNSDDEESGSKGDEWSEEESVYDAEIAEDSMMSFASDKNNTNLKDNENSLTDSDSIVKSESGNTVESHCDSDHDKNKSKKRTRGGNRSDCATGSDSESSSSKRFKLNNKKSLDTDANKNSESAEEDNAEENYKTDGSVKQPSDDEENNSKESSRAVLVLKRNGSSFTCIPKTNTDSS